MTTTKTKCVSLMAAAMLAVSLAAMPMTAYAWSGATEGNPADGGNSTEIQAETSGQTIVNGWIGTFDSEVVDPDRPDPSADQWINVKIPTTALFGSLATDSGAIYSPKYYIYNYSAKGVNVTPQSFTAQGTEAASLSGMALNLNFLSPAANAVVLRNASDEFLGDALSATETISLAAATSSTEPAAAQFTMSGTLPSGFVYPTIAQGPLTPAYTLSFTFSAVTS